MLKDTFELAVNIISKNPIIFKVCLENIFEFLLHHQIFGLKATLLLVLLLDYCLVKKQNSKKDLIGLMSLGDFEIVLILLAEIIAI